jgi:hypothetical protein
VTTTSNPFDCFLLGDGYFDMQSTWQFIDCLQPLSASSYDNSASHDMACIRVLPPSSEIYLTQISTVAALFTLVMSGSATVLGWALARLTTKRSVRYVYIIPITLSLIYTLCLAFRWFHTPLSIFAFIAAVSITTLTTKVRMVIGFDAEETRQASQQENGRKHGQDDEREGLELRLPRSLSVQATHPALQHSSYREDMTI